MGSTCHTADCWGTISCLPSLSYRLLSSSAPSISYTYISVSEMSTLKRKYSLISAAVDFHVCVSLPVDSELLLVVRRPGGVLLLGGIVGLLQQHVHQLEVNRPVHLQVNGLLLLLKRQDVVLTRQWECQR